MATSLLPKPETIRPSQPICAVVMAALRSTGYRLLANLQCEVQDGIVKLSGSVPSFFLKQMAQSVVLRLDQVKRVENSLEVREGCTIAV